MFLIERAFHDHIRVRAHRHVNIFIISRNHARVIDEHSHAISTHSLAHINKELELQAIVVTGARDLLDRICRWKVRIEHDTFAFRGFILEPAEMGREITTLLVVECVVDEIIENGRVFRHVECVRTDGDRGKSRRGLGHDTDLCGHVEREILHDAQAEQPKTCSR